MSLLASVGISLSPANASLSGGQTQQFTPTVTGGSGNTAVTWSLNPNLGTISSSGLYTAPASITSPQTVTVTATSVADPSKSAASTVTLLVSVSVSLSPASASLSGGQTQQFTATVTGGSGNTAVTWSLNPNLGTITSGGLYTAPASIASEQSVTVTATSVADSRKSAASTVTLLAPVSISVSLTPNAVPLYHSQAQQFSATVTGTSNKSVTWSIVPAVGAISSSGLYTAPPSVGSSQTVSVIATSIADPMKSATSIISLYSVVGLTWIASISQDVAGYHVYRANTPGGPYTRVDSSLVSGTAYEDLTVVKNHFYYYVATAGNRSGSESVYSGEAMVLIQ